MSEPIKLLVVDDHVIFRRGVVGLLDEQPDFYIVGEANNGVEAVQLCQQQNPDVVLMDVHMPGGGGVTAVPLIKQVSSARIIMLTISNKDADLLSALAAGANGYLLKSAEPEQLCQAIRQVAAGQSVLSPEVTARVIRAANAAPTQQEKSRLSPRESEVLTELSKGATTTEIATTLIISKNTVKTHIRRILTKLEASNRAEAIAKASVMGLI